MTQEKTNIAGRYRWYPHNQVRGYRIPSHLRGWLLDPDSLTRRLQQNCGDDFHVRVFAEAWGKPELNEAQRLGIRYSRWAWIREVHLFCGSTPLVFARTVIPRKTLSGGECRLTTLGRRPLGAVLFADPRMRRSVVELARIPRGPGIFEAAVSDLGRKPSEIWGRRSVFRLRGKPLLVSEIFLPAIKALHPPPMLHNQ